jgi:hypothetical protein
MTHPLRSRSIAFLFVLAVQLPNGSPANAQDVAGLDAAIHQRWTAILPEVARQRGATMVNKVLTGVDDDVKRQIYREAIMRLADDPEIRRLAVPDLRLVKQTTPVEERQFIDALQDAKAGHTQPKSLNAASTNPAAGSIVERSGFTEMLALALNGQDFFNANATAVSLNINALALFSLADPNTYSELYRYQQHSLLRRIGGTVVFGAKIPQKEITGLSGLPDPEKLFDAFTWDVKVRVLGDKDSRSHKWYEETLGLGGMRNQLIVIQNDVPVTDAPMVTQELQNLVGLRLAELKARINRSPQLTFKSTGMHLTKEAGKNKYTFGFLFDEGFGEDTSFTANLLYAITDDVRLGAGEAFQIKQLTFSASLTAKFAHDVIVKGRTVDWTNGSTINAFTNKSALPIDAQNTWKLFSKVEIPWTDAATIPLAIVYTNDKNELQKTQYMSGFIGVSYDFSALPSLFKK